MTSKLYWHVDIDATKAAAHRLGEAIVACGGEVKVSMAMGEIFSRFGTVLLVVKLKEGLEERFRELAKPITMKPPPKLSPGMVSLRMLADEQGEEA